MALYQRTAIEQKGYGMIAKTAISPGRLILVEEPLFSLPSVLFSREVLAQAKHPESTLNTIIATAVKALPKDKQVVFLELHNSKTRPGVFLGIWQTNAFGLGSDNDDLGIFELASRFNHSCFPNAVHSWNYNTKKMEIHATKAIPEGTEITMSYLSFEEIIQPCAMRRTMLQGRYGFTCSCHACASPGNAKSIAHRTELAMLDGELARGNFSLGMNAARPMKNLRRMLELFPLEGLEGELGRVYNDAFQLCIGSGDQARASAFMELCVKTRCFYLGTGLKDDARNRELVRRPQSHHTFQALGNKWGTKLSMKKKEGSVGFDEWLWERAEK
ncbi:SET domain-containing protein [Terfezia boudieri ATCC MYA-4762]|uniref:SET domain-containing protein n=1 Tax=Terfezia boudieri ATCC MYA-4762 TaxID=1051890 RepID=A0A3N4LMF9_9PEZI|nr:SET domain-containing protein [Terfezia boudieri ATCC MYA-4762]